MSDGQDASFESWRVAVSADALPELWLREVFDEWGAVGPADFDELVGLGTERILEIQLELATALLPAVLADARAAGLDPVVDLYLVRPWQLWLTADGYQPSSYDPPPGDEVRLLAWLADMVQEPTMERDQHDVFVWPVCPTHRTGGHAEVVAGVAVWQCRVDGGHVIAAIGRLGDE